MHDNPKIKGIEYFNSIAEKWDSWEDLESLKVKFAEGLKKFAIRPEEHILDVGCGTGNLTGAILTKLSLAGRITAVDFSDKMIKIAKMKVQDSRIRWICDSIENLIEYKSAFDRIICYSIWPHIENHYAAGRLFLNMLRVDGKLHIWHLKSREEINRIHTEASQVLRDHLLAPASETATLLEKTGFVIDETFDNDSGYLVTARKVKP